ncbi:MAG: hypothetical protein JRM79_02375 [Nitrososphaerota archaeon]|jgi:hypothetical protein|nr:hypothetical protein [Nitrososphaerota archaeon]MDG6903413.1 hypothetical protein [Nitrososphaerota archaeon]MDG6940793.1 hypothetical protein [Nitrososphaerota archaeon]MDG6943375.1 hypothetical protein [Nitrososphaerota archaeon]MDG6945236.1 hypothetical protein [Nitrososphaerota archaeon]
MQVQETSNLGEVSSKDALADRSLCALLALVGSKRMGTSVLRRRTKLSHAAFDSLLGWLQREYLVDVVSTMTGLGVEEEVALTERGEALLVTMLETTCELPEFR